MKPPKLLLGGLFAGAALAVMPLSAADLQGRLVLRPLTPSDQSDYKLSALEKASGLSTVPINQPVYLEAEISSDIAASDIVSVTWALTNQPLGSVAVITNSPLGTNVPIYSVSDRLEFQVAGRAMLVPDVTGQYTILATITTASGGATTVSQTITAGTYMGINTCALCHSGGLIAPNMVDGWSKTMHASKFTRGINGQIAGYSKNCISCHTVGFDTAPLAVNGGFDDIAAKLGWTFPTVLTNSNFAAVPPELQNLANIQCENCHGPGSEHAHSLGNPNLISVSFSAGNCGQCHDAKTHHIKNPEWNNSKHAISTREPSGPGRDQCIGCHTGIGFAARMDGETTTNTAYEPIGCAACHDPHDATNPHQLRNVGPVTLKDGFTTISNGGKGELCMNCHMSRRNATNYVDVTKGGSTFGPHEGPQADMLAGVNAITYGKDIPSSAHLRVVEDTCVHCHMQDVGSQTNALYHAGGHTFNVAWDGNGTIGRVELTEACKGCHGDIDTFNFPRQDYDGDGVVDGVQTEVQHLMDKLAVMLPPVGVPKDSLNITTNWTKQQLKAGYNYKFVQKDGSHGIHNLAYAVGILKASIADLTGDANNDGLPDSWQIQYFGSISNPNAAPNATPAGDGIPNWLKYSLGIDPTQAGASFPGGVVWAAGKNLVNPPTSGGETNSVRIYTAAEVVFDTETGKNYQIQAASSLSQGWQNVGTPITGTGSAVSYVTPTRSNLQQYYRVIPAP